MGPFGAPFRQAISGVFRQIDCFRSMPPNRKSARDNDHRRALELLADAPEGVTEAIMRAHGFSVALMVDLVHAGLATATAERVVAGSRKIEVTRVRITEAGRQALNGNVRQAVR
jgi:hypothetical protein